MTVVSNAATWNQIRERKRMAIHKKHLEMLCAHIPYWNGTWWNPNTRKSQKFEACVKIFWMTKGLEHEAFFQTVALTCLWVSNMRPGFRYLFYTFQTFPASPELNLIDVTNFIVSVVRCTGMSENVGCQIQRTQLKRIHCLLNLSTVWIQRQWMKNGLSMFHFPFC